MGGKKAWRRGELTSNLPILSSNHSTLCFRLAIVAKASLLVLIVSPPTVLGATPHNSAYCWDAVADVVAGVGRGVPGDECVWKDGGGEFGTETIEGARPPCEDDATELGIAVL